ncbi:MAG TPA: DUF5317 family protein [Candidatus Limnocylindrales bacterium]|nr:DUF5317 family protein [Candidatus Limnocylindrales bacterium]
MFLLYAVLLGLLLGFLVGGRPAGLAAIHFRWAWLAILGFAIQVVLFAGPVSDRVGDVLGPIIYVGSTALVLVAVLRNVRVPGLAIVAAGAASNLTAIVANGGYMPAGAAARAEVGQGAITTYSNSKVIANPVLEPLTDVLALPAWLPFTNVFSVGDLLIAIGVVVAIVVPMWWARPGASGKLGPVPGTE